MNKKLAKEISQPFMIIGLVAMLVLSTVVLWFNAYLGLIALVITGGIFFFHMRFSTTYVERTLERFEKKVLKEREDYMDAFAEGSPLLICVAKRDGYVSWSNPAFSEVFEASDEMNSFLETKKLAPFFSDDNYTEVVKINDKQYCISSIETKTNIGVRRMFFFRDVTDRESLSAQLQNTSPCVAYVSVDNYDEMLEATPVEDQSSLAAEIDKAVHSWAISMQAAVLKAKADKYMMVFEHKFLDELRESKFPVLNTMHDIETQADFPASLSIGICYGNEPLEDLQDGAAAALDLALGRGGDQAVIRSRDGETEYFGGALPSVEKRHKGKSRVMAHMLAQLIENSPNVLIMGHARPDMDCYGAAVGLHALANKLGKYAGIVLEEPGRGIELIYQAGKAAGAEINFVTREQAFRIIEDDTLLVIVDHHRQVMSEYPQLISAAKKIAVIDHHRRAKDAIENPVLSYMEPYVSSTSELITEILQYSGDAGEISRYEAEALLAGITLDTKNFTVNTGVRTFEAASWLRRNGADNANIKNYFKVSLEFYRKKAAMIAAAEILPNGVAVAYTKEAHPSIAVLVSQVADELLDMSGVDASIVSGRSDTKTMVSARSNGKINVQTMMEKVGGGGHQNVAAAQVDVGPEEAIALLVGIMRDEGTLQ